MDGTRAEREQGSSNGASNPTVWKEAPSHGLVDGHASIGAKRRRHICIERQRRVRTNTLLDSLQQLLPNSTARGDQGSLLTNVIAYIQSLEEKTEELRRCKKEVEKSHIQAKDESNKTFESSTLVMPKSVVYLESLHLHKLKMHSFDSVLEEIIISFTSLRKLGMFSNILLLLEINKIKIVHATFTTTPNEKVLHFIHAQVSREQNFQIKDLKALFSSLTSDLSEESPSYERHLN